MNWLIGATVLVIFAAGCAVALWWWKLVARIAPYKDEVAQARKRGTSEVEEVVVISQSGEQKRQ